MMIQVDTHDSDDFGAYGTIRIPFKNACTIVIEWSEFDGFNDRGPSAQMFVEGPGMQRRGEPKKVYA